MDKVSSLLGGISADDLEPANHLLVSLTHWLASRVAERTRELEESNRHLEELSL